MINTCFRCNRPCPPIACVALLLTMTLVGCGTYATKGAGTGAATGALAGAAGGVVSALVFGGDPLDAAARGAVWGGTTGAVAGGVAGAQVDKQTAQKREAEIAKLRAEIGDDAFDGLEALADCEYDTSLQQAGKALASANPNFSLAGAWLEVLSYADQGNEARARSLFPALVAKDWNLETSAQAEASMRKALTAIGDIREEYNRPRVCST